MQEVKWFAVARVAGVSFRGKQHLNMFCLSYHCGSKVGLSMLSRVVMGKPAVSAHSSCPRRYILCFVGNHNILLQFQMMAAAGQASKAQQQNPQGVRMGALQNTGLQLNQQLTRRSPSLAPKPPLPPQQQKQQPASQRVQMGKPAFPVLPSFHSCAQSIW